MSLKDSIINIVKNEIFEALLQSELCDDEDARKITDTAFQRIQNRLGGCRVYVPKCKETNYDYTDIRLAFNGSNHGEVCRRFGISLRTLYRVIG